MHRALFVCGAGYVLLENIAGRSRAFSSEVGTGSREENASKQKARASVSIQSERKTRLSSRTGARTSDARRLTSRKHEP